MATKKRAKRKPPKEEFVFEVISARDLNPKEAAVIVVAGPPGSGKSDLLGKMCVEGPTLLICTLAREGGSRMYQKHNPDVVVLEDDQWKPEPPDEHGRPQGTYEAHAFMHYLDLIEMLVDDEITAEGGEPYRVVLTDSGTELAEAGWHESLKPFGVMDPAYMAYDDNRFGPYTALTGLMERALTGVQALRTCSNPKHVGFSWHVQPTKEDTTQKVGGPGGYSVTKESADTRGEGVEYEGNILPMIRGAFRRKLFGKVDVFVWTDVLYDKKKDPATGKRTERPNYVLQVVSDEDRHCKIPGPVPKTKHIPNSWPKLKALFAEEGEEID